ncbi:MAG: prolyl oligopeptidase family serine peptidase [Acidobacteriota bacterium]
MTAASAASWRTSALAAAAATALAAICSAAPTVAASTVRADPAVDASLRPLDDFLVRPRIGEVALSPRGDKAAYLLRGDSSSELGWLDTATGERHALLRSRLIDSIYWSGDGGGLFMVTDDRLGFVDLEGGAARWLHRFDGAHGDAEFLGVAEHHPRSAWVGEVLADDRHRLLRVDADGGLVDVLERDQPIRHFLTDSTGEVRYLKRADGGEQVISRLAGDGGVDVLRCDGLGRCLPVALEVLDGGDRERLWMLGDDGGDLIRLYALDLDRRSGWRPIDGGGEVGHVDPLDLADLRTVVFDPDSGRPRIAVHDSDRRRHYGLDAGAVRGLGHLERHLPGARLRLEVGAGDGPWLVEEGGPRLHHPRYYLLDPARGDLREILADERARRSSIPASSFAEPRFVTFAASDGLPVHGLLTVPAAASADELRAAPVVVRVHGGPWNHVRMEWSGLRQFLVSRGYVVYESNFRASTGFGRRHITAAAGDFGDGRVQLDILEGLDDVHARGVGDPDRVVIMGHSFGGFSTLGGLAFTPKRFVAGIASAPPIDLVRAIRDLPEDELQSNGVPRRRVLAQLVGDLDDPEIARALRRRSPEAHLAATERPLLMFAGGADPKVDIVDVRHYAGALRGLGRDVSLVVDPEQGHSFEHPVSTGAYLFLVERFLAHHLGGTAVGTEDPRIRDYVERHLVFSGPSLVGAMSP